MKFSHAHFSPTSMLTVIGNLIVIPQVDDFLHNCYKEFDISMFKEVNDKDGLFD